MDMYARAGRRSEALRQYEACAQILRVELNVDPDAETKGLANRLRKAAVPSLGPSQPQQTAVANPKDDKKNGVNAELEPEVQTEAAYIAPPLLRAERRQVTVMTCKLLNACPLSLVLDPEDFRSVTDSFKAHIQTVVRKFGGAIAQNLDDGAVAYFGHPFSHEDDAERAVRAALHTLQARPNELAKLEASAGIASGLVVVEDADKASGRSASGAAPYLAMQLQSYAKPDEVLISEATRRHLGRFFHLEFAEIQGKESGSPVRAYRVIRDRPIGRFKALRAQHLTPFTGRLEEMELLHRRWEQATSGEGRAVLLSGEPGIGKSRLIHQFSEKLRGIKHTRLSYYCSPLHTQSTLYPFSVGIERTARIKSVDNNHVRLRKIERLWRLASAQGRTSDYRVIADLLGVRQGDAEHESLLILKNKETILKVILDFVAALAERRPVFAVVEDAHWMDPTSLELVERLISSISSCRILLLLSARPEFQPGWLTAAPVSFVSLSRMPEPQSEDIIAGVTSGRQLPEGVRFQILSQADGVPLYLEELTRSLLESGKLVDTDAGFGFSGALSRAELPDSLQSSLISRLDRVSSAKKIAQIGAVIGAAFYHGLIAEVSRLDPDRLQAHVKELIDAGLIYRRGDASDAVYVFRHAMVRDAAYSTVLKSDRRHVHASIAQALAEKFPAMAEAQPELVAHHFTEAQLHRQAIDWWLKAGKLAGARWAGAEAISHVKNGLALLDGIPAQAERDMLEYKLQLTIWPHLIFRCGADSEDATNTDRRIAELMPDGEPFHLRLYVSAMQFLSSYYSGKIEDCRRAASDLLSAARKAGERPGVCVAQAELAIVLNFCGEFRQALDSSNDALKNYDETSWAFYTHRLGWEPSVVANCQKGVALLSLGRLADAQAASANAINLAEAVGHPAVNLYAYCYAGLFPAFLAGDFAGMRHYASRCIPLGKSYNVPQYVAWSDCLGAAALAEEGKTSEALQSFESGRRVRLGLGYIGHGAITKLAGAFVYWKSGDIRQALELCKAGLQESEFSHEKWVDAELWRVRGDLFLHPDLLDVKTAEDCYRTGLAIAKKQGSLVFALKCAMSLSRLLQDLHREKEALEFLQSVYDSFLQGRNSQLLRKAQTLLGDLRTNIAGRMARLSRTDHLRAIKRIADTSAFRIV